MPTEPENRSPLSSERVIRAAVRLADEAGLDSLSMRRLGQELGVEAMSLYSHVANKDAILDGMVEAVVGEIALFDPESDWKTAMRRRGISAHEVLMRHPWATKLIVSRVNDGPAMLRYVDSTIGILRAAGFPIAVVDHAWNAMDSYIYGFTLQKLNFPFQPEEYSNVAADYLPQLPADDYPHLVEMTKAVIDGTHDGLHEFTFGFDLVLDGLERALPTDR
ncbi:MAG: TetR/AcrR family transcriptional regulator C-terminal domain-containing protein [Planctomycetota bacterium]|jgi:AcrR family transcriptional regulator